MQLTTVNLQRAQRFHTFPFVRFDWSDPLDIARAIFGLALGVTSVVLVVVFATTGNWKLLALVLALWTFWGIFRDMVDSLLEPLAGFVVNLLTGGYTSSGPPLTIEQETAYLERLLQGHLAPHHEILSGIRLAEIYRTHQHDQAKADAMIERLVAKYPGALELRFVTRPRT